MYMHETAIIRKQRFRVRTNDSDLALKLRKKIQEQMHHDIIPALEKVFNTFTPINEVVEIPKIRIDLGKIAIAEFEQKFSRTFALEFEKQLVKVLKGYKLTGNQAKESELAFDEEIRHIQMYGIREVHVIALLYFLNQGLFPWYYLKMAEKKTPSEILLDLSEPDLKKLADHATKTEKPVFLQRLIEYYPEEKLQDFLPLLLSSISNDEVRDISLFIKSNLKKFISDFAVREAKVLKTLLQFLLKYGRGTLKGPQLFSKLIVLLKEQIPLPQYTLPEIIDKLQVMAALDGRVEVTGKSDLAASVLKIIKDLKASHQETLLADQLEVQKSGEHRDRGKITLPDKVVYIQNAGLIILHPFFEPLFKELKLIGKQHEFISEESRQKAAVVLNYLYCGSEEYNEWEMALNKVICNIPFDHVLPQGIILTEAEKEECSTLLNTVVKYWDALKNTSAGAMQETFFGREGKLSEGERSWLLQIEHKTIDILVQKIPWGIGVVKFTWSDKPIYVEW